MVTGPVAMPAGAERAVALVGSADQLLVIADDGSGGRMFQAPARGL
jgi:hypothetical protein